MSVFNTTTKPKNRTTNHEGHEAFTRSAKMELFLLACGAYAEQGSFYESKSDRSQRLRELTGKVAVTDPEWLNGFIGWLRSELGMRTAAVVVAAEAARIMNVNSIPGGREIVNKAIFRADEPGELLAYWLGTHGRKIPFNVKKGVADAVERLYNERNYLKFDSDKKDVSFKDVLRLVHPGNKGPWQAELYEYITKGGELPANLKTLQANREVRAMAKVEPSALTKEMVSKAGLTWEDMPSLTGKAWDAENWELVIPSMRFLATLRNLNNFAKVGLSQSAVIAIRSKLESAEDLRLSKTGPLNILAAIKSQTSAVFTSSLGDALNNSLVNVPKLDGSTLILIDTSSSMWTPFSKDGKTHYWEAAALFGIALAKKAESAHIVSFSSHCKEFYLHRGQDLSTLLNLFRTSYNFGGGTNVDHALKTHFKGQDRVIILTDEQYNGGYRGYGGDPTKLVHKDTLLHTYNLAGYRAGGMSEYKPNRFYTTGLSDKAFTMLPLMEMTGDGTAWPWEK